MRRFFACFGKACPEGFGPSAERSSIGQSSTHGGPASGGRHGPGVRFLTFSRCSVRSTAAIGVALKRSLTGTATPGATKMRLDAGKTMRISVSGPLTVGFERLFLALGAICRCPSRSKERSWPQNCRESGECRFIGLQARRGTAWFGTKLAVKSQDEPTQRRV